ncbi:hypothetical protein GGR28_003444 [Lewinella aquimaris]|uniref:Uncharacterized protein n=1 Tax=Neolewinella aquimaris TaxID=1835722 RepID=A0A840EG71_9BACT|nr:hypothetical protein [Neolewinella aquimaris]MBB4080809.1 hypothetical protein [Neolewinella aquimaris]
MRSILFFLALIIGAQLNSQLNSESIDTFPATGQIDHEFTYDKLGQDKNVLQLLNNLKVDVIFLLSHNKLDWETYKLKSNESLRLLDTNVGVYYARIYTSKYFKNFSLQKGHNYVITFDAEINKYVFKVVMFD